VPDLRRLQYFLAVAQERNFTRAAERLHVAQPALSRQVRLLEEELGVELLHRTTHEFELTDAGAFLLERGPALLSASDELWRSVRSFGAGERGALHVAYGASVSYETAPRLLTELAKRNPAISLSTEVKSTSDIVAGVRDGSVDVGVVRAPPKDAELETRTVRVEPLGVLLHQAHRLAAQESIEVGDLADETLLMHAREANPGHYDLLLELCRERGVEPRIRVRTLSFDPTFTPLAQGEGVAIVAESAQIGIPTELRWVPLSPRAELEVALVVRRYGRSPALDRLLDTAAAVARERGWLGHAGVS
jgi:DNA-binding transcriptional LysR family regulator